jgi:serine/threonine protein phosphatase PrpC
MYPRGRMTTTTRPPPLAPHGVRFNHRVVHAAASHIGHVRTNNEDVWRADPSMHLYAVADGMGGHDAGEIAAAICMEAFFGVMRDLRAVTALTTFLASPSLRARRGVLDELRRAAESANGAVREEAERIKSKSGLGCTLDAVLLVGDRAFVLHAGDGRVYLARAAATIQLTNDHDVRAVLAGEGKLTLSQRRAVHNQLLNAIGMNAEATVECAMVELIEGDRLVLCTDGVHEMIGDEAAIATLAKTGDPAQAARGLVDAALGHGGRDNATALVVAVLESQVPRRGVAAATRDLRTARSCPLFVDLPDALVLRALTMAVEVELDAEKPIPRIVTTDHVAYIVLEGEAELRSLTLGRGALLYPESLLSAGRGHPRFHAKTPMRALRLRADDFREICAGDTRLAAALFERLARHLATLAH